MTGTESCDVLVVGGGPAGSSAALRLARSGWRVVVLDRVCFPRDKPCGEFLTPGARRQLESVGAWDYRADAGVRVISTIALCDSCGERAEYRRSDGRPVGYGLRRIVLDERLLACAQEAGAEVRSGWAVRAVQRDSEGTVCGVEAQTPHGDLQRIGCRLLIGADGARSRVARELGMTRDIARLQRIAIVSHWRGVAGPTDRIEMFAGGSVVCGLAFPGPDGAANFTVVLPRAAAARIVADPAKAAAELAFRAYPALRARFKGASCEPNRRATGCFGHTAEVYADGVVLVGDAAGFTDPFTGEGVYMALRSAELAAEAAETALRRCDVRAEQLAPYGRAYSELRRRYRLCDIVQAIVRQPWLYARGTASLCRSPELAETLFSVIGHERPADEALNLGFVWRMLVGR